jgi:hypothetical protein
MARRTKCRFMYCILKQCAYLALSRSWNVNCAILACIKTCNAVELDRHIVLPEDAPNLVATLEDRGYRCHELPMSEFLKAGGACKCLTMFCRNEKQWSDGLVE